jgi:hypothetical protein
MKSYTHFNESFFKGMLFSVIMVIVTMLTTDITHAQEASSKKLAVYPSLGLALGVFYPQDVNNYIKNDISGYSDTYNTDLYAYFEFKAGLTFRLKRVDFNVSLEEDIAPKIGIVIGGEDFSYYYNKLSPEISANFYFPTGSGKNAFFIGAGVSYNFLSFEEYRASCPGVKAQLGYSLQFGKMNLQPYLAFKYIKATDSSTRYEDFVLDYTGGQIGFILSLHKRMYYN